MDENLNTKSLQVPVASVSIDELIQRFLEQINEQQCIIEEQRCLIKEQRSEIDKLANTVAMQKELIQELRDEIAILKGQKPKPKIAPSSLEGLNHKHKWRNRFNRNIENGKQILFAHWVTNFTTCKTFSDLPCILRIASAIPKLQIRAFDISRLAKLLIKKVKRASKPGQPKGKLRNKKKGKLEIHARVVIQPVTIPVGAKFKGYKPYLVQDIIFQPFNTLYLRAQWLLPNGDYLTGELPKEIRGHYGPELISYIFYQSQTCRVTEPLLHAQLIDRKIRISSGQINNIITKNISHFHEEVEELLPAGVAVDNQIQVDDTGGRHKGKNQYTTIISNKWFSVFSTTESKSRINFLKLLQGGKDEYLINDDTLAYLREVNVSGFLPGYILQSHGAKFRTRQDWEQFLKGLNITQNEERFVTEAALFASLFENGIPRNLMIHSDDAGQFDIVLFLNTLCWIHEERHYRKLIMTNDQGRADLERIREQIWSIYSNLKTYKLIPNKEAKKAIERQFDDIFSQQTSSPTLNHQLQKTYRKKEALLGVLERVESPLHNNGSETPARSAKTKLKVSGGTRSDQGREARDTFLSLRQTCLKLGINFIEFLHDRVRGWYKIPKLAEIIRQRALEDLARQFSKYALAILLAYQLASTFLSKIIYRSTSSALIKVINLGLSLNVLIEKSLICEISQKIAKPRLIHAEILKKVHNSNECMPV